MPTTPKRHFNEDIARADAIVAHASPLPSATPAEQLLRDDFLRSGWMFAVGAMDAYFCDAYVHCITTALRSKSLQATVVLPAFIKNIRIPIGSILSAYANRPNWKWRMTDALHYHMYQMVVLANHAHFGGSNAYVPYREQFHKQVFHLHGQDESIVAFFDVSNPAELINRGNASSETRTTRLWKTPPADWQPPVD